MLNFLAITTVICKKEPHILVRRNHFLILFCFGWCNLFIVSVRSTGTLLCNDLMSICMQKFLLQYDISSLNVVFYKYDSV